MKIGYYRISTDEQETGLQVDPSIERDVTSSTTMKRVDAPFALVNSSPLRAPMPRFFNCWNVLRSFALHVGIILDLDLVCPHCQHASE